MAIETESDNYPKRCIICHRDTKDIKEVRFIEPTSDKDARPVTLQGYMCLDCAIVNWGWVVH